MAKAQDPKPPAKKKERAQVPLEEMQDKMSMSYIRHAKAVLHGVVEEKPNDAKPSNPPPSVALNDPTNQAKLQQAAAASVGGRPAAPSAAPSSSVAVLNEAALQAEKQRLAEEAQKQQTHQSTDAPSFFSRVRSSLANLWQNAAVGLRLKKKPEEAPPTPILEGVAGDVFEGPKKPRLRAPNQPNPRVTPLNRDGEGKVSPQELFDPESTMAAMVGKGGWQHHQPNALNSLGRSDIAQDIQFDPETTRDAVVGRVGAKGSWHHQQRNQFNSLGQVELDGVQLEIESTVDVVLGSAGAKGSWHHQQRNQFNSLGQVELDGVQLEIESTVDVVVGSAGAKGSWHHQQRNQFNTLERAESGIQLEGESTVDVVVGSAGAKGSWHHQQRNQFNSLGQVELEGVQLDADSTVAGVVGKQAGQANWFHHQRNALNNIGQAELDNVNLDPDQTVHGAVGRAGWAAQSAPNESYQHVRQHSNAPFHDAPLPVMRHVGREAMPVPAWETEDGEPTAAGGRMHIVRQGETLEMIAYMRGVSVQAILKTNPQLVARDGSYPAYPPVGSALLVP